MFTHQHEELVHLRDYSHIYVYKHMKLQPNIYINIKVHKKRKENNAQLIPQNESKDTDLIYTRLNVQKLQHHHI